MIRRWMARFSTLSWRLTLFYCGLLAILLAAVGISVYIRFEDTLKSSVSNRLRDLALVLTPPLNANAKLLGDVISTTKASQGLIESIKSQLLQDQPSSGIYIGVLDSNGRLIIDNQPVKQPNGLETVRPRFLQPIATIEANVNQLEAKEYEVTLDVTLERNPGVDKTISQAHGMAYVLPVWPLVGEGLALAIKMGKLVEPTAYLVLAAPLDEVESNLQQIAFILVTGLLGALAIALLLGLPLARLGLKPLRKMADTATHIGAGDLSRRVELTARAGARASMEAGDEVGQLAQAFNAMLDRIETSFEAQKKSEARTRQFAADASHEMRSPLTVLGGYLDVMMMGAKDDPTEAERILNAMQRENNRLSRLVVDLLLLTRMDANGTAWLRLESLPLKDLIMRAVDNMRMVAGERRLQAVIDEDRGDAIVLGDGDQLYRMLTNLLDNAIRHTGPHGQIAVSMRSDRKEGWARLRVADDGCGIGPGKLPRIFDRFYRADESRARQTGNAGLGLAICKSIVEAHGGRIDVESVPGKGTVFTVDLPLLNVPPNGKNSQRTLSAVSGNSKPGPLN